MYYLHKIKVGDVKLKNFKKIFYEKNRVLTQPFLILEIFRFKTH